jgi:hypothetical protein
MLGAAMIGLAAIINAWTAPRFSAWLDNHNNLAIQTLRPVLRYLMLDEIPDSWTAVYGRVLFPIIAGVIIIYSILKILGMKVSGGR